MSAVDLDRSLVQPVSAIATRISASISFSTCATPGSAARRERIGPGAAQQHEVGAEREHPHHVEARAHAAVGEDRQSVRAIASAIARQRPRARQHAVELASAVVGNDDRVGAAGQPPRARPRDRGCP